MVPLGKMVASREILPRAPGARTSCAKARLVKVGRSSSITAEGECDPAHSEYVLGVRSARGGHCWWSGMIICVCPGRESN